MTVWFSNSVPIKGVCIDTFRINEFGDIIEETTDLVTDIQFSRDIVKSIARRQKSLSVELPFRKSPPGSIDSRASSLQVGSDLTSLVKDAQSAFEQILTRNASLEQEVTELRNQSYCDSSTVQSSGRRRAPSVSGMLTRRNLENFPTFNISTPPRAEYIDLSRKR